MPKTHDAEMLSPGVGSGPDAKKQKYSLELAAGPKRDIGLTQNIGRYSVLMHIYARHHMSEHPCAHVPCGPYARAIICGLVIVVVESRFMCMLMFSAGASISM